MKFFIKKQQTIKKQTEHRQTHMTHTKSNNNKIFVLLLDQ